MKEIGSENGKEEEVKSNTKGNKGKKSVERGIRGEWLINEGSEGK